MTTQVNNLVEVFQNFRMNPLPTDEFETKGKEVLINKMSHFINNKQPIKFSIMGFPFKSPNDRDKVIGKNADGAEKATMDNFKAFNQAIKEVYNPGIKLSVVSDGLVFNDIMEVDNATVQMYKEQCIDMSDASFVEFYNLLDFYNLDLKTAREKLINQFGISEVELQRRILLDPDVNTLYRGMIRFMGADLAIKNFDSNTQLQKVAKHTAKSMMFRNEAFSKLIQNEMSDHIRLSMHPSINNGTKFSFQLIRSEGKVHGSAWHSTLAIENGINNTMHKKDAIEQGYELVYLNGVGSHFEK